MKGGGGGGPAAAHGSTSLSRVLVCVTGWTVKGGDVGGEGGGGSRPTGDSASKSNGAGIVGGSIEGDGSGVGEGGITGAGSESIRGAWWA